MSPGKSSGDVIFDTLFPPSSAAEKMDIEALSGICGSISIACWVVVFSPQIIENFRRHSADGISLLFLAIWLLGDVFNILGAVMQRVLPTMIILAVYYTLADIVLLAQCLYYRGLWPWLFGARKGEHAHDSQPDIITTTNNAATMNPSHASGGGSSSNVDRPATADSASSTSASEPFDASLERSPLLQQYSATATAGSGSNEDDLRQRRRRSFRERLSFANGEHLSPTVPMVEPPRDDE
ncbi:hypothetical protein KEM52_002352 [Ascosphaera acerosa]|nr:hypothetical protein KEM52_002352 [Ascosphaera acerosa]